MALVSQQADKAIDVVFEHQDFYIVSKTPDIGFHDEKEDEIREKGFFNQACQFFNETLYPVHRLDKLTSGLLILARNKAAATWFQQSFEAKTIQKLYLAVISKKPKKKQGSVIGDMAKARGGQWKLVGTRKASAVTRFFTFGVEGSTAPLRYALLKPETGKTHQIRVALKSLGAPIVGDTLYGGDSSDRGYLHAYALRFDYQGKQIEVFNNPRFGLHFLAMPEMIISKIDNGFDLKWPTGH